MVKAMVIFMVVSLAACSKPARQVETKPAVTGSKKETSPAEVKKEGHVRRTIEIYETQEVQASSKKVLCREFKGRCFKLLSQSPLMTIKDFSFEITEERTVIISLSAPETRALAQITRGMATPKGAARRLALLHQGRVLHVPKVRSEIKTDKIRVSFCDKTILDNFKRLKNTP